MQVVTHSVEPGEVRETAVEIHMKGGRLRIAGGAEALAEAEFGFNDDAMKPAVEHDVREGVGVLKIHQPDLGGPLRRTRNEWEVQLGGPTPIDLMVRQGVGELWLDASDMPLRSIDISVSMGALMLDLTRVRRSLVGELQVGTGRGVLVRVPVDVGVRLRTRAVVGDLWVDGEEYGEDDYVNAAFATSDVKIDLAVGAGMGDVDIEVIEVPE